MRLIVRSSAIEVTTAVDAEARSSFNVFSFTEIKIYLHLHGLKPLKFDYATGWYIAAYAGLFDVTNRITRDEGNGISQSDYASKYALYAYKLASDPTITNA